MKYRQFLILILLVAAQGLTFAQEKKYSEEVTVVARYVPSISDANKINFSPKAQDTIMPKPELSYGIKSTLVPTDYKPEALEPAKMAGEPIPKLYDNYLKAGFGNYSSPLIDLYHNNSRSKDLNYGFNLNHFSSQGEIDGYGDPAYSQSGIKVFTRKNWEKKSSLNADMGFNHQVVHYYGFKTEDFLDSVPSKEDTKQRYALFSLNTGWKTAETDSGKLSNELGFHFYYLADLFKTSEASFSLNNEIGKSVKWFKFSPTQRWEVASDFQYFSRKTDTLFNSNSWLLGIKPSLSAQMGGLNLKAGLNIQVASDSATKMHIYPMIEVNGRLIPGVLSFYAGIDGNMKNYSFYDLSRENPYSSTVVAAPMANVTYRFYGGLRARFFEKADLSVEIAQSHLDKMPFFVTDFSEEFDNKFIVMTDEVDLLTIKIGAAYHLGKKLEISDALEWQKVSTSLEKPWHVPELKNTLSFRYNLRDKVGFNLDFIYYGQMYAPDSLGKAVKLDARPDLNLGVTYQYSKLIGAFLNVSNLLNQNYPLWYNYPSKGLQVLGGVTFSF